MTRERTPLDDFEDVANGIISGEYRMAYPPLPEPIAAGELVRCEECGARLWNERLPAEPAVTGLVERLENAPITGNNALCREAADTITRLEAEKAEQVQAARSFELSAIDLFKQKQALQSERDDLAKRLVANSEAHMRDKARLRKALDEIIPSKLTIAHAAKS
jgi:hypothetical protein